MEGRRLREPWPTDRPDDGGEGESSCSDVAFSVYAGHLDEKEVAPTQSELARGARNDSPIRRYNTMATVHHQSSAGTCEPKFIQPFPPECRVIVDDVDDDRLHPVLDNENSHKSKTEATDSDNASSRENPLARIKRFQVEAESRKIEFARLLEEHAQVIRRLKQMEETESTHHFPSTITNVSKA